MMDRRIKTTALRELIEECDCECNRHYLLDFEEFCQIILKYLIEVEEEGNRKKEGQIKTEKFPFLSNYIKIFSLIDKNFQSSDELHSSIISLLML